MQHLGNSGWDSLPALRSEPELCACVCVWSVCRSPARNVRGLGLGDGSKNKCWLSQESYWEFDMSFQKIKHVVISLWILSLSNWLIAKFWPGSVRVCILPHTRTSCGFYDWVILTLLSEQRIPWGRCDSHRGAQEWSYADAHLSYDFPSLLTFWR